MKITKDIQERICELKDQKMGIKKISDIIGCCPNTVTNQLRRANCEIIPRKRYKINQDFFETIDSEEKAYWLGFVSADGCVTERHLRIQLARKDEGHLEKFLQAMESNHPIKRNERICKIYGTTHYGNLIVLANKKLVKDLFHKGIHSNKSLVLKPYNNIPEDLQRHYWRGFIDGDGCLRSIKRQNREAYSLDLVGSKEVIEAYFNWCGQYIQSEAKPYIQKKIFGFKVTKRQSLYDLLNILYNNCSVFLDRKKAIADSFLTILPSLRQQQRSAA